MKKTRFLVLSLAVAIMLMGAGYAYWTETLTIENTVTTGALEFAFINGNVEEDEFMDESYCTLDEIDNNKVNITLNKMYPGAQAKATFGLINEGTMDAKLKNFRILPPATEEVAMDYFQIESFIVDGTAIVSSPVSINLFNASDAVVELEKGATAAIELVVGINSAADENQVREAQEGENAYNFAVTFDGLQWNDNEN